MIRVIAQTVLRGDLRLLQGREKNILIQIKDSWNSGAIPWICDWPIHWRFHILTGLALASSILFLTAYGLGEREIGTAVSDQTVYRQMSDRVSDIRSDLLAMQTELNGLIQDNDRAIAPEFRQTVTRATAHLSALQELSVAVDEKQALDTLSSELKQIGTTFDAMMDGYKTLGMTDTEGLQGALTASLKAIQDELAIWPNQDTLNVPLLQMQLAQRDFLQLKDRPSLGRHRRWTNEFDLKIDGSSLDPNTKANFHRILDVHTTDMQRYSELAVKVAAQVSAIRKDFVDSQPVIGGLFDRARDGARRATVVQERTQGSVMMATTAIIGLSGLVFFLVSLLFQRSISRPLDMMSDALSALASGSAQVEVHGAERKDEIGQMAKAARVFKDNLTAVKRLQSEREAQTAIITNRAEQMEQMTRTFDTTVDSIMDGVGVSVRGLEDSANSITTMAQEACAEIAAVATASNDASERAKATADAAEQLFASIHLISRSVSESANCAEQASVAAQRTDTLVTELSDAAQRIGDVVKLISTIASQTNMLAMNATIEAARAGERGKGFAVVASEVKALANQTAKATGEISSHIGSIQRVTQAAVSAIRGISQTIHTIREIAGTVKAGVGEQENATRDIAQNAAVTASGTEEISQRIARTSHQANRMGNAAHDMLQDTADTANRADALRDTVERFLGGVRAVS